MKVNRGKGIRTSIIWVFKSTSVQLVCCYMCINFRGGVASLAGPALAGPLFSRSSVSFPDCRDSLRMRPTSGSGVWRCLTELHQHPFVYDMQLLACYQYGAFRCLQQFCFSVQPYAQAYCGDSPPAPVFPVSKTTVWKEKRCVQVCSAKLVCFLEVVAL